MEPYARFVHILHCLFVILGLIGFGWLSLDQVKKFLHNKTSVSSSVELIDEYELPTIIFCPAFPFHANATNIMGFDLDGYKYSTKDPDVELDGKQEWTEAPEDVQAEVYNLYTAYNGNCTVFQVKDKLKFRQFLGFSGTPPYEIYLSRPGEEFRVVEQSFTPLSTLLIHIPKEEDGVDYMIELSESRFNRKRGCEPDKTNWSRANCLLDKLAEEMRSHDDVDCLPVHYERFLKDKLDLPICERAARHSHKFFAYSGPLLVNRSMAAMCPPPCESKTLDYRNVRGYVGSVARKQAIMFSYPINQVDIYEEYVILDTAGIVASVGGGLGLFLGFSCLSTARTFLNYMHKKCTTAFVSTDQKA